MGCVAHCCALRPVTVCLFEQVNQDPSAHAPRVVSQATNATNSSEEPTSTNLVTQIFARPLGPTADSLAVVLFNRGEASASLSVSWAELGLRSGQKMAVRDVIAHRDLAAVVDKLEAKVGRHDVAFYVLKPAPELED